MKKYLWFLVFSANLFSYNMSDAVKEIRLMVQDSAADTVNQQWMDTELYRRVELAQNDIIRKSGCLEQQSTITTSLNAASYPLISDCLEIRRVEFTTDGSSNSYLLGYVSKRKLDTMNKDWRNESGKPLYWTDVLFSSGVITIYPRPSTAYSGKTITYDYIGKIDNYSSYASTTTIFEGRPMLIPYYTLVNFYVARLCSIDSRKWTDAQNFKALYDEGLIILIQELNSSTIERTFRKPTTPMAPTQ